MDVLTIEVPSYPSTSVSGFVLCQTLGWSGEIHELMLIENHTVEVISVLTLKYWFQLPLAEILLELNT